MKLKDKQTGEIDEYLFSNKRGDTNGVELNKGDDINDPILKPFENVAEVRYAFDIGIAGDPLKTIKIADRDYYEILPDGTKKTKFTWDEAMEIEKKTHGKWRVPTQAEWFAIAAAFGTDNEGEVTGKTLVKNLNLTTDEGGYGNYWSSTPYAATSSRGFGFRSTSVYPQDGSCKTYGCTVRCVAR